MVRMKAGFISHGKEGIVKARAVEDRLMRETWQLDDFDLLPKVHNLNTPTLVMAGDHDFFPGDMTERLAWALPNGHLTAFRDSGHFAYLLRTGVLLDTPLGVGVARERKRSGCDQKFALVILTGVWTFLNSSRLRCGVIQVSRWLLQGQ